jgi:hypothetical protein
MVKDETTENEFFYGVEGKGYSHAEFERKMDSLAIKEWGWKLGPKIWKDELSQLLEWDLSVPAQEYDFHNYCELVYESIFTTNCRTAETLYYSTRFWTLEF